MIHSKTASGGLPAGGFTYRTGLLAPLYFGVDDDPDDEEPLWWPCLCSRR
jgi:hypothetical protein